MTRLKNWEAPEIKEGQDTKYGWRVSHVDKFYLGDNTDIGYGCYFQAEALIFVCNDVQIGSHCSVYSVSTIDNKKGAVIIRQGAKIGSHSTIMPGVTIGTGAIVGAHSFVDKDIPKGEVWFGVPARPRGTGNVERKTSIGCRGVWVDWPRDHAKFSTRWLEGYDLRYTR